MGLLSKAWKGVKGAVKKVAKGVKKVAKAVTTSMPGGQKLWKASGKLGKNIMKGISKIGPIGMIAIQVVLSMTGVGAIVAGMMSAMWSGFGVAAAAAAASANALVSAIGTVGTGIFAAGNFVVGTLGAIGNAVSEGASQLMSGNFSQAAQAFGSNMGQALSGEAGMASVNAASAAAQNSAGVLADNASSQITAEQTTALLDDGVTLQSPLQNTGAETSVLPETEGFSAINSSPVGNTGTLDVTLGAEEVTTAQLDAQVNQYGMTVAEMNATPNAANAYVTNGKEGARELLKKEVEVPQEEDQDNDRDSKDNSGGGGGVSQDNGSSLIARPTKSGAISSTTLGRGQGSEGFSLLKGVKGLEKSLRDSQNLMFT